jgi:hypothetical protein
MQQHSKDENQRIDDRFPHVERRIAIGAAYIVSAEKNPHSHKGAETIDRYC